MTKKGIISLCCSCILLIVLFLASSTDLLIKERVSPVYEVSVLLDRENDSGFENFKLGMDQAAQEYNVDISFVTLYSEKEPFRQVQMLLREAQDGAQGFIVAAENQEVMEQMMAQVPVGSPVVVVGSKVDSPRIHGHISPNYEAMATTLAATILEENPNMKKATVVAFTKNRQDIARISTTIEAACDAQGVAVSMVLLEEKNDCETLLNGLWAQGGNVVVAPEPGALEALAKAAEKLQLDVPIYGTGFSDALWWYVENGYVRGTVVYHGYDAGYFAVKYMVEQLSGGYGQKELDPGYIMVNASLLYSPDVEPMLFPIN